MENRLKLLIDSIGKDRFKLNEPLKGHTFSKSEGRAQAFYIATSSLELTQILDLSLELKIPYFIIGSGTKVVLSKSVSGLVIKNRSSSIKIAGIKGKVSKEGIGVEQAMIESDSGVSLSKLNKFVKEQNLKAIDGFSSLHSTVGGSIFLDPLLRGATQSIKVWNEGDVMEIKLDALKRSQVVLSVIFKFKSNDTN